MVKIIKLSAIDSTNSYLKEMSKNTYLDDGTIVVTNEQTHGRGQVNSEWISQPNLSLTYSIFKRFESVITSNGFAVSMAVAMGVYDALEAYNIPKLSIKWPNDIMSYSKKIGGILIENTFQGDKISSTIIGLGINVNETEIISMPQATSLKMQTGKTFNLETLLIFISEAIIIRLNNIDSLTHSFEALQEEYETILFKKDQVSAFEDSSGNKFSGIIKGVNQHGELCVENEEELLEHFQLKQIKMLY